MKRAASLRQRKFREREGAFLVEGADLVAAGLAAGRRPQVVFVRAERAPEVSARLGLGGEDGPAAAVHPVVERVAERISTLETPPDVMAVFPLPERRALATLFGPGGAPGDDAPPGAIAEALVVFADGIGDPGNMGTLLRAAVAFGATALGTAPGSADLYGPKTVRAGMGAVFGLPLFPGYCWPMCWRRCPGPRCTAWRRTKAFRWPPPACGGRPCSWWAPSVAASRPRPSCT